jgi:hypothetical protein
MTTTLGSPVATTRRQPVLLCVLVAAIVVVGWVLYRHYAVDDVGRRLLSWGLLADHFWLLTLVLALLLCVPYAVALLLWGRDLPRATAGAVAAVATGVYAWGLDRVFQDHVWSSGGTTQTSLRVYEWSYLLVVSTLVPLAWGLARRSGRRWPLGLVVGPVSAAILRELQLRSSWWQEHVLPFGPRLHWQLQAVVFVAPFVLAALACWAIEAHGRRTPEMGSSA